MGYNNNNAGMHIVMKGMEDFIFDIPVEDRTFEADFHERTKTNPHFVRNQSLGYLARMNRQNMKNDVA